MNRSLRTNNRTVTLGEYLFRIKSPGKKYEDVIERQRAEIDDLRARLIERKRLEETWKEMLNVLLSSIKSDYVKQKVTFSVTVSVTISVTVKSFKDNSVIVTLKLFKFNTLS